MGLFREILIPEVGSRAASGLARQPRVRAAKSSTVDAFAGARSTAATPHNCSKVWTGKMIHETLVVTSRLP
jgi:hypothetical protein